MLSHYLEAESRRWAAQQQQSYPAPSTLEDSLSACSDESDAESIFSRGDASGSRRSSISSAASDDLEVAAPAFAQQQPRDFSGAPITIYTSLDQAVAQSSQRVEAQGPRRLVTPGKLYENEDDDDEIVEADEDHQGELLQYPAAPAHHAGSYTPPGVIAVG
ncbi:hypothetical protein GGR53DRAFT_340668 [Hypoxylon sp. FL1150]|nr:hypothetical protein GGR53DRAFT_340668 [Hypoxylon sp. FL1150]